MKDDKLVLGIIVRLVLGGLILFAVVIAATGVLEIIRYINAGNYWLIAVFFVIILAYAIGAKVLE